MRSYVFLLILLVLAGMGCATTEKAPETKPAEQPIVTRKQYVGALAFDFKTGIVLSADNSEKLIYPASMVKLMDLLIILDKVQRKEIALTDKVTITPQATDVGGIQVNLRAKEVFTVEDLLYAIMIKSANDAAVALAIYVAGSEKAFIGMMNSRARELGMASTVFYTVNGLPSTNGRKYDISTPRDIALLGRELLARHPEALKYTSCRAYQFRGGEKPFVIRTHNYLLYSFPGCDGLKTGYNDAGGFSIIATALQNDRRVIAVVAGCSTARTRDLEAQELMRRAFLTPLKEQETQVKGNAR